VRKAVTRGLHAHTVALPCSAQRARPWPLLIHHAVRLPHPMAACRGRCCREPVAVPSWLVHCPLLAGTAHSWRHLASWRCAARRARTHQLALPFARWLVLGLGLPFGRTG